MSGQTQSLIEVEALDHVHLYAADPNAAADWYARVLGLKILPSSERLHGACYIATSAGQYCATIFPGTPPSDGDHTTAFRVTGDIFMTFGEALPHPDITARGGGLLEVGQAADHDLAFSFYFQDADGNHLEITTYDHAQVRAWTTTKRRRYG